MVLVFSIVALVLTTMALAMPASAAPHAGNPGGNCDTTATSVKTDTSDGSIVLAEGTIFCVKASDTNSGTLVADGETTLNEYLVQEGIDHNVSNYVVYGMATPDATPDETPDATPDETPDATPDDDDAALNIRKVDEQGNRLPGAVFTVEGMQGTFTTGANGHFCITGLPDDSVWLVTEIQAPAGYEIADPASQLVEVDDDGDCNSPDAVFVNPLASTATPTPLQPGSRAERVKNSAAIASDERAELTYIAPR
jgi:hypothetical protein